jgi:outer membrane immunogenic protein
VTGGLAFANVKTAYNNAAGGGATAGAFSFSQTRTGWTLGAGVEYAISNNWSARAEYRYTDFGSFSNTTAAGTTFWSAAVLRHKLQEQSVRVGISYKFGGPAGPVVARY